MTEKETHYRVIIAHMQNRIYLISEEHAGAGDPPHKTDVSDCSRECTAFVVFLSAAEARTVGEALVQQADNMEFPRELPI